ncbi:uncharacterized protein LOC141898669 [Tubulanus polymorphus]|uniref:uncharacterized protein LOC141898669 n=1 Tax=Tubulanus polymorphus TaxID=672921 RepID=UPI003DA4AEF5
MGYFIVVLSTLVATILVSNSHAANKLDIAIMLDASEGVSRSQWQSLFELTKDLVRVFQASLTGNHISVSIYSSMPEVSAYLDTYDNTEDILRSMAKWTWIGQSSRLDSALSFATSEIFQFGVREDAKKVLIIVGSGYATDFSATRDEILNLWKKEVSIYSLSPLSSNDILRMALPSVYIIELPIILMSFTITSFVKKIESRIHSDTECAFGSVDDGSGNTCVDVDECTGTPCALGGKCVNLLPVHGRHKCICPQGLVSYKGCRLRVKLDLAIIIDTSTGVHPTAWPKLFELFKYILKIMYVHPAFVRVALAAFSDKVWSGVSVDSCGSDLHCIIKSISDWSWNDNDPNIGSILEHVSHDIYTKFNDRDVPTVVLYVGSGRTIQTKKSLIALREVLSTETTLYAISYDTPTTQFFYNALNSEFLTKLPNILNFNAVQELAVSTVLKIKKNLHCGYGKHFDTKRGACVDTDECDNANPCFNQGECTDLDKGFWCPCPRNRTNCLGVGQIDIVMILDCSNALSHEEWVKAFAIFKLLTEKLFMHHGRYIKIATLAYADTVWYATELDRCEDPSCISNDISLWTWRNKPPHMSIALEKANAEILNGVKARPAVKKMVIYVGSGTDTNEDRALDSITRYLNEDIAMVAVTTKSKNNVVADMIPVNGLTEVTSFTALTEKELNAITGNLISRAINESHCKHGYHSVWRGPSSDRAHPHEMCEDLDECTSIRNVCPNGGACVNSDGSFKCKCPPGDRSPECLDSSPIDISLYIDKSAAVSPMKLQALKDIVKELILTSSVHLDFTRLAVYPFDTEVRPGIDLDICDNQHCIAERFDLLKLSQSSSTDVSSEVALAHAREIVFKSLASRKKVPKTVIVVGSGGTMDEWKLRKIANCLALSSIRIYTITFDEKSDVLGKVVPLSFKFLITNYTNAWRTELAKTVISQISRDSNCTFGYAMVNDVCKDVNECTGSKTCPNNGACYNTPGSYECACLRHDDKCKEMVKVDVAFLMDSSSAIYQNQWELLIDLAEDIINQFYIDPDFVHLSIASYSSKLGILTSLSTCTNSTCAMDYVKQLLWNGFDPKTNEALTLARTDMLMKGHRKGAKKVLIYVGSGVSMNRRETFYAMRNLQTQSIRIYEASYTIEDNIIKQVIPKPYHQELHYYLRESNENIAENIAFQLAHDMVCGNGYYFDEFTNRCVDINECKGTHVCFTGGNCMNLDGSYTCT